jgi:ABC-type bacteriocin/lantibiotic exporter with double-glycine peptidase domain
MKSDRKAFRKRDRESLRFNRDFKLIRNCFVLLSKDEISRLKVVSICQLFLALLDFVGVMAIGLIGMLSVYGIQSRTPSGQLKWVLETASIQEWNFQAQVATVGLFAGFILILKSLLSALINRKTTFFLSARSAEISVRLIEKLTFSNLQQIKKRSRFENIFAITNGVQSITLGIIGTFVNLFADVILIAIMFVGLLFIDASIALTTVTLFTLIAFILYKMVNFRIGFLARVETSLHVKNDQLLYELFGSYREIFAGGIRQFYTERIAESRRRLAKVNAEMSFIPSISKYVLEVAFVVGAIVFVGIQFLVKDAVGAISSISVFIAASGRVIPAILRIQGAAIRFRSALIGAQKTLDVIEELKSFQSVLPVIQQRPRVGLRGKLDIKLEQVTFKYIQTSKNVLHGINLQIQPGEWIAIAGPSGAGKSTLVDVLLGIHKPSSGTARIAGMEPEEFVLNRPGKVAYVPQDTFLMEGTLKQNVALGIKEEDINSKQVVKCLEMVGLSEYAHNQAFGISAEIKELGMNLSGGQRQRLAIARALYSKPKILILDEATSALDSLSEKTVVDCLTRLKGKITIISIAHRLSTVLHADRVVYLEKGQISSSGTFKQVRKAVPNFDKQAKLSRIKNG